MAVFSRIGSTAEGNAYGTGDTTTASFTVQAGDLIAVCAWATTTGKDVDGISDSGGENEYTLLTQVNGSGFLERQAYAIAQSNATLTVTVDFAAVTGWGRAQVNVFRASGTITYFGELVGLNSSWGTGDKVSNELTLTENGTLVIASGIASGGSIDLSDGEIPSGVDATEMIGQSGDWQNAMWWSELDATAGVEAEVSVSGGCTAVVQGMAFYVPAGGGATLLPILLAMDHLSGGLMQ